MDYKEEYQKALERAKKGLPIDEVFPELKESEDERIRKQIEQVLIEHDWSATYKVSKDDCLAWLEKQKEQKPTLDDYLKATPAERRKMSMTEILEKEQKPAEWSEEDEKFFKTALWNISYSISNGKTTDAHCDTTDWLKGVKERLKSLRPSWKPSEEQVYSLGTVVKGYDNCTVGSVGYNLKELYEDLKKL